jgi:hypothetical protein
MSLKKFIDSNNKNITFTPMLQFSALIQLPQRAAWALPLAAALSATAGAEPHQRNVDGIMDNSFFVEEAYNQEPGVVQHIFNAIYTHQSFDGSDENRVDLLFTQEWPLFSQRHQLSYTVPYSFIESGQDGLGDMLLNYRFQAFLDETTLTAFAPRASLVLPTGDEGRGLGEDSVGFQGNLPFSTALGDSWFVHANAGLTFLPDTSSGADLLHYHSGASAIYAATPDLHFLVEWIGVWADSAGDGHEFESLISPGVRHAFNFQNGSQLVLGLAVPIGLTSSAPDVGAFLYCSFEHAFLKTP